jgi:purine-binding chemotaxis protein CheW
MEAITFTLAGEVYALESCYTYEVFRLATFSRLPSRTPLAFGVTVWRGHLLTILDVRSVLGLSVAALNDLARVIVVGQHHPEFGILADRAHEVLTIDESALEPARGRAYVAGLTRDAVLVLDAAKILQLHV